MPSITSAGSASGMDFESIIAASVEAKKAQLAKSTTTKKEESQITLSGIGKLKDALSTFEKAVKALTEKNGFNARKVTTDQPKDNPFFNVSAKEDASNVDYDIYVKQLAKSEKITKKADSDKTFSAGELTIKLPGVENEDGTVGEPREIKIKIEEGDTIDHIRKKINNNDYGVTASVVKTSGGDKLTIDSGLSGDDNNGKFEMSFTPAEDAKQGEGIIDSSEFFNFSSASDAGDWDYTKAQSAIINVDGEDIKSDTNTFKNQVSGLEITVNRVSEKDKDGDYKLNHVSVDADEEAVVKKMEEFVNAYNALQDSLDGLYKHNTYTDGKNNYDGGELAGDNMVKTLQNALQGRITNADGSDVLDIFSLGLEMDKDGKLKLDKEEFKEGLRDNYNGVVNLFNGENGLLTSMEGLVKDYTKSGGLLANREETLNQQIKDYEAKEAENAAYLEQYEASLRQKYARLDTTIAGYNNSLMYLQSALI